MQYLGGKYKISKVLVPELQRLMKENNCGGFVDMFCGSCNIVSKIESDYRYANDKHYYLIKMFEGVQDGSFYIPCNFSDDDYTIIRDEYRNGKYTRSDALLGFVGFGCSFAGAWLRGYARNKKGDNYCRRSRDSLVKKMRTMEDVVFSNNSYDTFDLDLIPDNSLIYCDIPYKNTTGYDRKLLGKFDHESFYAWARDVIAMGHKVYVSEYGCNIPKDAKLVWEHESTMSMEMDGERPKTKEILFTF